MLRNIKRVRGRVPVLPTMAARSTAPEAPGNPELAGSARRDSTPGCSHNPTASLSDTPGPTQVPVTDKPATAPLPTRDKPVMPADAKPAPNAARPTAPPGTSHEAPTDTRRVRQWLKIAASAASLVAVAAGWWLYRSEVANHVEMTIPPATRASDDLAQVNQALQQERDKAERLARELATARRELGSQAAALTKAGDKAAPNQQLIGLQQALQQAEWLSAAYQELLAQERGRSQGFEQQLAARSNDQELLAQERGRSQGFEQQLAARGNDQELLAQERARSQGLEQQLAARGNDQELLAQERARSQGLEQQLAARGNDQELLAQERARSQGLEQQLAAQRDTTPGSGRNATASLSDTPGPAPATDKPATTPLPTRDKPVMAVASADDKPATMAALLTAPGAPSNPDVPRLMARASLLLSQGNIGAARTVLDRAAETGSALALFALAETYDPIILAAWGTFGTQGDAAKARELYARALAGGVQEARDRLNALR
jgi:hypothetical protein